MTHEADGVAVAFEHQFKRRKNNFRVYSRCSVFLISSNITTALHYYFFSVLQLIISTAQDMIHIQEKAYHYQGLAKEKIQKLSSIGKLRHTIYLKKIV